MASTLEFLPLPEPSSHTEVIVRVLTQEESLVLAPVFAAYGEPLPDPRYSHIIGAVLPDGTVTNNFLVVQLRVHAEPMNIEPGDEGLVRRLVHAAEDLIARRCGTVDVFTFAPAGKIARMAQVAGGMQVEPWVVLSKRVEGVAVVPGAEQADVPVPDNVTEMPKPESGPEPESSNSEETVATTVTEGATDAAQAERVN